MYTRCIAMGLALRHLWVHNLIEFFSHSGTFFLPTVKISPRDLHLISLICANPKHPDAQEWLASLDKNARAVAILILHMWKLRLDLQIPEGIPAEGAQRDELDQAAKEFGRLLSGRRNEHEHRMRVHDTAHPHPA